MTAVSENSSEVDDDVMVLLADLPMEQNRDGSSAAIQYSKD